MVFWTAKLRSRTDRVGLRRAIFLAKRLRHVSISFRKALSTVSVPRWRLESIVYLSNEPLSIASFENVE